MFHFYWYCTQKSTKIQWQKYFKIYYACELGWFNVENKCKWLGLGSHHLSLPSNLKQAVQRTNTRSRIQWAKSPMPPLFILERCTSSPGAQRSACYKESIRTEKSQTRSSFYRNKGKFLLCQNYDSHLSLLMSKPLLLQVSVQVAWS